MITPGRWRAMRAEATEAAAARSTVAPRFITAAWLAGMPGPNKGRFEVEEAKPKAFPTPFSAG